MIIDVKYKRGGAFQSLTSTGACAIDANDGNARLGEREGYVGIPAGVPDQPRDYDAARGGRLVRRPGAGKDGVCGVTDGFDEDGLTAHTGVLARWKRQTVAKE